MTKYVLDDYDGPELDYSTLGFRADTGDILDATGAPDARWSVNADQAAAETVTRYTIGGDGDYVEPGDGHVLTYSDADNRYVPEAPATFLNSTAAQDALSATYARGVSVKDPRFGAIGDGIADDTAAIQEALDFISALGGGTVYVPAGTYLTSNALIMPSDTVLTGSGWRTIIKSNSLPAGTGSTGHRQIDATGKGRFVVRDLTLDASEMTVFSTGMRSIWADGSSVFRVTNCRFITPGAATAAKNCTDYWVDSNRISVTSDKHDGIIDQWGGSKRFHIRNNTIGAANLGRVGVMVTGESNIPTQNEATPCNEFTVADNTIIDVATVGIHINGREGVNNNFTVAGNVVKTSALHGILVQDSRRFTMSDNVISDCAANGIRLGTETGAGGTVGCVDYTVTGNVVDGANTALYDTDDAGSAILVVGTSNAGVLSANRVSGANHRYAITLVSGTTNNVLGVNHLAAGTVGTINNAGGKTNVVPSGRYTPTLTGVANVAASAASVCRWTRSGNRVTVTGRLDVTANTASSTATQIGISLPVASNLGSVNTDLAGSASNIVGNTAALYADIANDQAEMRYPATFITSTAFYFTFSYDVI